ncbi:DUF1848 domain-containing protein [Desulfosediminicola flagellatus]|uniref:DUF1848 domain-containing protein n=1 Tax=Desulfosediminicola flagellatus TaxID=2569541 RepID=UPI002269A486|nr:DUF1848 domain-containing protein [Desulfosediminicola flagellatus]
MNRVKAGYCAVPNPFNIKQVGYVSLRPDEVEAIVFWTRNPAPLMARLAELNARGFDYYFLFTLVNNPREIDPYSPSLEKAVAVFHELADRIGPERVIWRYDPIFLSSITPISYHIDNYCTIAEKLAGSTRRSFISFVDDYRKASGRMETLRRSGVEIQPSRVAGLAEVEPLVAELVRIAGLYDIELLSCAEKLDLSPLGVAPGKCIDDALIQRLFKVNVAGRKDPSQRKECGCVMSREIGMYDSCLFGCCYCYATRNFELARRNHRAHDPTSPSLLGRFDAVAPVGGEVKKKNCTSTARQLKLF